MYYLLRAMVCSVSVARDLGAAYQTNVSILRKKNMIEELSNLGRAVKTRLHLPFTHAFTLMLCVL